MKLNFILLLTIIRFLKADDLALCSSSYCSTAECQTVSDKCTNDSYAQEVVSLPSPDVCNCCTYCLENIVEGGECAVGSAGAPIPTSICGPGLTCDSTTKTCIQKTDTPCTQAQQVYDQKKQNGTLGMLETRPLCDSDGYYDTYKCIPGQNCFCVDKNGDRIFGEIAYTETPSYFLECQCSRKLQEAVELIGRDLHPNEFFRCLDNGDFDQLQCIDDLCFCVDNSDGALTYPKSPSVNITQISNTTLDCFDEKIHKTGEFYTSCALEYVEMAEQVAAYMSQGFDLGFDFKFPNCTPDGKYAPVQQTTNTIYCADPDGELIGNYSISTGDSRASGMDCTCARSSLYISSAEKPICCENGNYRKYQCRRGFCYCVDGNGVQIDKEVQQAQVSTLTCSIDPCVFA